MIGLPLRVFPEAGEQYAGNPDEAEYARRRGGPVIAIKMPQPAGKIGCVTKGPPRQRKHARGESALIKGTGNEDCNSILRRMKLQTTSRRSGGCLE